MVSWSFVCFLFFCLDQIEVLWNWNYSRLRPSSHPIHLSMALLHCTLPVWYDAQEACSYNHCHVLQHCAFVQPGFDSMVGGHRPWFTPSDLPPHEWIHVGWSCQSFGLSVALDYAYAEDTDNSACKWSWQWLQWDVGHSSLGNLPANGFPYTYVAYVVLRGVLCQAVLRTLKALKSLRKKFVSGFCIMFQRIFATRSDYFWKFLWSL